MEVWLRHTTRNLVLMTLGLLSVAACATSPGPEGMERPLIVPSGAQQDRRVLAGEWEYEEDAAITVTLDENGNGSYPWKGGRFETHSLSDHTWQGRWIQQDNDREGGFTVQLSPDYSNGEGRWWYTRIENDLAPKQKGGTFHVTKKSPAMSGTPPGR
jgi:hypothetical protein